tara:strand:- start:2128 stop:2496 length:369 start_codon:yes stop_codon:yes gene_type:complete
MTYTFTYTINTHSVREYQGKRVINQIMYTVGVERSDGKSCDLELSINFPLDCATKVIPYTRQKYDESDNVIAESEYSNRTDFKEYDDLTIPNDLITWVKNHHENDAAQLQSLKNFADYTIGA